jgi:hypothetical protein
MTEMRFFADIKTGLSFGPDGERGTREVGFARGAAASAHGAKGANSSAASESTTGGFALGARLAGALAPIASIERETDVSRLVGAFDERLAARFPIDETPRRGFLRILFELFQNIPQHANAAGDILDPHGIAAMHDDEQHVVLAIADKGIGLARSLGLRPDPSGHRGLSDADALRAVVFDGRSRFRDPGRGHELERIFRRVRSWEGTMVVRSGSALLFQSDAGGDVVDVAPFPGVQLALSIPRFLLGLGEGPLAEGGVESRGDPGFNEADEEDDD